MKKIIVAIDSFKGCLTSAEANQAAFEGIQARASGSDMTKVVQIPVSDGGEGWLEAFRCAVGGEMVDVHVKDPFMRPIVAQYLVQGDTAVIEIAKASGLTLLSPGERNPMVATSYGSGQLVVDAVRRGCKHIIVGLGGSATSDCGIGMLRAIIDNVAKGGSWDDVHVLDDVRFTIATDVTNPLCGENGAAYVFGPQKFAVQAEQSVHDPVVGREQTQKSDKQVLLDRIIALDARAKRFAEFSARHFGYDRQDMPGAGAAGGLGYAFLQYLNAECRSGIDLLLDTVSFDEHLLDAALVITGEGAADRQTLMGKLPYGILLRAKSYHVPVMLIAGRINDRQALLDAGFQQVECINAPGSWNRVVTSRDEAVLSELPIEEAMKPDIARKNIALLMESVSF